MINFNEIETTILHEFNGGRGDIEGKIFQDGKVKIMKAELHKNTSIGLHTHLTSCEIVYILNGVAKCIIDDCVETVKEGQCHYCPKGASHSIVNESEEVLVMLCVVPNQ